MKSEWHASIKKLKLLFPHLNEKQKRLLAAAETEQLGKGSQSFISVQLGISRNSIQKGVQELQVKPSTDELSRVRRKGGGRKSILETQPQLVEALKSIVSESTRGDPESPLLWTSKSTTKIAKELGEQGFSVSPMSVYTLLKDQGYSLQANKKVTEGKNSHPDRDQQFKYLNKKVSEAIKKNEPVISVDTKKKELIGEYKNAGQEWKSTGEPREVLSHDFPDPKVPKAVPYGIYDVKHNEGFVNIGTSSDTGKFAVQSIRTWWRTMGEEKYPNSKKILICADSGGSNGYRNRLWKNELQNFCNENNLEVTVCHLPPGTSKWNKIEHRLFSEISKNWRGRPLVSYETVLNLISSTETLAGLRVKAKIDRRKYKKGIKISDKEFEEIGIEKHLFHGEWNYTIRPSKLK